MEYARNSFHRAAESIQSKFGHSKIGSFAAEQIILSQKFIVPDAGRLTDGTPISKFQDVMNLPFDRVALLREIDVGKKDGDIITQQICIAVAPYVLGFVNDCADLYIVDCLQVPGIKDAWAPSRPIGVQWLLGGGACIFEIDGAIEEERSLIGYADTHEKGFGALNGLTELMLMLSLSNVTTKTIIAPEAINRKRQRNGKLPLYDYHVLLIDGKETCSRESSDSTDRSIRSHFRRGHIRRLNDGRRVWVKQAYVHGRTAGFVDKDYMVPS
jgi:hypothetical protein